MLYITYITFRMSAADIITARGFYIAYSHNGCGDDHIYLLIIQNQVDIVCGYDSVQESDIPKILYSPSDSIGIHSDNCKSR